VCVDAFHDGRLPFTGIVDVIGDVLTAHDVPSKVQISLDDVLAADAWARETAGRTIEGL
jgi:1-deoxy-D-xylulose-5-phosphate reductoisomerase